MSCTRNGAAFGEKQAPSYTEGSDQMINRGPDLGDRVNSTGSLRLIGVIALAALFIIPPRTALSQEAVPTAPGGRTSDSAQRKTSRPYTGDLSIFESPDRDKKLQVERVMDTLNIHAGSAVADVGAGSGWFTVRAAKRVGDQGIVYAVDINPEAIK